MLLPRWIFHYGLNKGCLESIFDYLTHPWFPQLLTCVTLYPKPYATLHRLHCRLRIFIVGILLMGCIDISCGWVMIQAYFCYVGYVQGSINGGRWLFLIWTILFFFHDIFMLTTFFPCSSSNSIWENIRKTNFHMKSNNFRWGNFR